LFFLREGNISLFAVNFLFHNLEWWAQTFRTSFRNKSQFTKTLPVGRLKAMAIEFFKLSFFKHVYNFIILPNDRISKDIFSGGCCSAVYLFLKAFRNCSFGSSNTFLTALPNCDKWMVLDNMDLTPEIIAQYDEFGKVIVNDEICDVIQQQSNGD